MVGATAYRELDGALGLTAIAGEMLADARTGKNGRHALVGMLRQAVFGRLDGYEDVNDAERLRHDPAMRWIVGGKAASGCAASASQMGRFETRWLTAEKIFRRSLICPANGSTVFTRNQKGNFKVGMRTEKSRLKRSLISLQELMRRIRHHKISVTRPTKSTLS